MPTFDDNKPRQGLSHADRQWNRMWELWVAGQVPSPYAELMRYHSEVNNGGHDQYFCNTAVCYDLNAEVEALLSFLPQPHAGNLRRAYELHTALEALPDGCDEQLEEYGMALAACDAVFYENEEQLNALLRSFADTIVLPREPVRRKKLPLTAAHLRFLALALMLLDHMNRTILPGSDWLTALGRLAFPIFAFQCAEGYRRTHDFRKYCLRLLIFALISEIPFDLAVSGSLFYPGHQNVMFTLLLGLLACRASERKKPWQLVLIFVGAAFAGVDYGALGVLTVLMFHQYRTHALTQLFALVLINCFGFGLFTIQSFAVLAWLPICLYNGEKGPGGKLMQYGAYAFYPLHLLILGLLA